MSFWVDIRSAFQYGNVRIGFGIGIIAVIDKKLQNSTEPHVVDRLLMVGTLIKTINNNWNRQCKINRHKTNRSEKQIDSIDWKQRITCKLHWKAWRIDCGQQSVACRIDDIRIDGCKCTISKNVNKIHFVFQCEWKSENIMHSCVYLHASSAISRNLIAP